MAYDEELADRVRALVNRQAGGLGPAEEKQMFGGLSFLLGGHLAVCASGQGGLLVRVAADEAPGLVDGDTVAPMVMGGRESKTWLRVAPEALDTESRLEPWVARGVAVARSLPPKC